MKGIVIPLPTPNTPMLESSSSVTLEHSIYINPNVFPSPYYGHVLCGVSIHCQCFVLLCLAGSHTKR